MSIAWQPEEKNGGHVKESKHSRTRSDPLLPLLCEEDLRSSKDTVDEAFGVVPVRRVSSIPTVISRRSQSMAIPGIESHMVDEGAGASTAIGLRPPAKDLFGCRSSPVARPCQTRGTGSLLAPHDNTDISTASKAPIPLRRVSSSPPIKKPRKKSLLLRVPSTLGSNEQKSLPPCIGTKQPQNCPTENDLETNVTSVQNWQLDSPYRLRRYNSTPLRTLAGRLSRTSHSHLLLARTLSSSSIESSMSEEDELVWLSTPKNQNDETRGRRSSEGLPSRGENTPNTSNKGSKVANALTRDSSTAVISSVRIAPDHFHRSDTRRRIVSSVLEVNHPPQESVTSSRERDVFTSLPRSNLSYLVHLSAFAMFGEIVRVYMSRLFGFDCEFPAAINDFLSPLSRKICVTASGRTLQTGGALFIDLPANMLGSFALGLMTSLAPDIWPPLPWLRDDHPLQGHDALHVAIKTGFCGSLTTFASWNTQMIVMLDGTATELGSQVLPALCGYILGLYCAVASFIVGRHVSTWLNQFKSENTSNEQQCSIEHHAFTAAEEGSHLPEGVGSQQTSSSLNEAQAIGNIRPPPTKIVVYPSMSYSKGFCHSLRTKLNARTVPFILLCIILILFIVADFVMEIRFYRTLWMSTVVTPPGALLRWTLAKWNERRFNQRFAWVPWGTVAANLFGSLLSAFLMAMEIRYVFGDQDSNPWLDASLAALRIGFAGSLTTVSTFVQELVELTTRHPQHAKPYYYAFGTIFSAIVLGICIYIPLVRGT